MVLAIATGGVLSVWRWLGVGPYGGSAQGIVVSKNVLVLEGRKTQVEYFIAVRTSAGTIEHVAVSSDMFQKIGKGWKVQHNHGIVTATAPDGTRVELSATTY